MSTVRLPRKIRPYGRGRAEIFTTLCQAGGLFAFDVAAPRASVYVDFSAFLTLK